MSKFKMWNFIKNQKNETETMKRKVEIKDDEPT